MQLKFKIKNKTILEDIFFEKWFLPDFTQLMLENLWGDDKALVVFVHDIECYSHDASREITMIALATLFAKKSKSLARLLVLLKAFANRMLARSLQSDLHDKYYSYRVKYNAVRRLIAELTNYNKSM